jgi:hypothetical protein
VVRAKALWRLFGFWEGHADARPSKLGHYVWRLFAFWEGHADARRRILAGELDVVFPAGTFRWHRLFGFPREELEAAFFESAAFG